ncbi:MAG: hypothetical protein GY926_09970, partial [bacterium]|nr:hypothetical protein [bacterium]
DVEGDSLVSVTITGLNLNGGTLTHSAGATTVTNGMTVTAAELADLTFTSALNDSTNSSFTYTVNDANLGVTSSTMNITVNAVNDDPTITNLAGDGLAYSEGDRAVVIEQGSDVVVADVDSTDFDTGTLTISFAAGSDASEDVVGIRNQGHGTGEISVAGWGVAYEGTLIG